MSSSWKIEADSRLESPEATTITAATAAAAAAATEPRVGAVSRSEEPLASRLEPVSVQHVPIPANGADFRGKVVLAPMVRSGELPSRLLALHYGADLVWGPETVDRAMIGTTRTVNPRTSCIEWSRAPSNVSPELVDKKKENVIYRIDPTREKGRLIYQIGTANPDLAVQAARLVAADVAGIDVNAGCPKPFSTSGGMGAALLKTPDLLASILRTLVDQIGKVFEIGISVKIRLLDTPQLTESLVRKLCQTGIIGLTVHCRTTPMRPRERAIRGQLRMVGSICREHGVACLMNGDVINRDEGLKLAEEYGVDGAMIATAAEKNSSIFRTTMQGGPAPWQDVVKKYMDYAMSVENKWGNTRFLLSQLIPGKDASYKPVTMSKTYAEGMNLLGLDQSTSTTTAQNHDEQESDGMGDMMARAMALDDILGLNQPMPTKSERKQMRKQIKRALEATADKAALEGEEENREQQQNARKRIDVGFMAEGTKQHQHEALGAMAIS